MMKCKEDGGQCGVGGYCDTCEEKLADDKFYAELEDLYEKHDGRYGFDLRGFYKAIETKVRGEK